MLRSKIPNELTRARPPNVEDCNRIHRWRQCRHRASKVNDKLRRSSARRRSARPSILVWLVHQPLIGARGEWSISVEADSWPTFAPQASKMRISSIGFIKIIASANALCRGFAAHSVGMLWNRTAANSKWEKIYELSIVDVNKSSITGPHILELRSSIHSKRCSN